jgi:hypothetical protein
MPITDGEARLRALENQVAKLTCLLDIEEIKRLQSAYGYYLEHWMADEVIDCFAEGPDTTLYLYEGAWLGKEGVRKYFNGNSNPSPEFLHQVMQITPIITLEPDSNRAKGRWYSWGCVAAPGATGVRQFFLGGIYENEYIKQDGVWKILILKYSMHITADPREGWVKPERIASPQASQPRRYSGPQPDIAPGGMDSRYPSGYIFPFHFIHPVTGKTTSEARLNAALKFVPNAFTPKSDQP